MSYTIIRPKDRDGWLEERKKGLGSSDAGTVMGVSPFSTPLKLYRQKLGLEPPIKESDSMRNGHILEPATAEYFALVTGSVIDYSSEGDWLAVDDQRPFLRVSPDRLFWPKGIEKLPENRLILELKSTSKYVNPDSLPLYWICQVQYQMGIMGIKKAAIAWITSNPKLDFGHTWIDFNQEFFNTIVKALDEFWNENLMKKIPPRAMSEEDIKVLYPYSEDALSVNATEEDLEMCKRYIELEEIIKNNTEELSQLATEIKNTLAKAETLVYTDPETGSNQTIAKFKSTKQTNFDVEKFKTEHPAEYKDCLTEEFDKKQLQKKAPELYEKYCSTVKGSRRFSVTLPSITCE
mgnify:CR=1 FL=1